MSFGIDLENEEEKDKKCPRNNSIYVGSPLCCTCSYNSGECEYIEADRELRN